MRFGYWGNDRLTTAPDRGLISIRGGNPTPRSRWRQTECRMAKSSTLLGTAQSTPIPDRNRCWVHVQLALSSVWRNGNDDQPPVPAPVLLPRRAYLCRLANSLAHRNVPIIAILDDPHQLDDSSLPEDLYFLLRHLERRFRLLAATRTAVPLALHRWRLSEEAMYGHPDPARWVGRFTGNERSIAEYLDVEVLAGQP